MQIDNDTQGGGGDNTAADDDDGLYGDLYW